MTDSCVLKVVWRLFILPLQHELTLTVSCQERGILNPADQKFTSDFSLNTQTRKQAGSWCPHAISPEEKELQCLTLGP